jgi:predicted MFS family arabinose efflux permease
VFNLASGAAMLLASVIAGVLWDRIGAAATFLAGAAFAALALVGLWLLPSADRSRSGSIDAS